MAEDLSKLGFMKLKRRLVELGVPKSRVDACPGKPTLLHLHRKWAEQQAAAPASPPLGPLGCVGSTAALQQTVEPAPRADPQPVVRPATEPRAPVREDRRGRCQEVDAGLWVGSHAAAACLLRGVSKAEQIEALKEIGVTHIVNTTKEFQCKHAGAFSYLQLHLNASNNRDIIHSFQPAINFIADAHQHGGSVLVHCAQGSERSGTIAAAYYMHRHQATAEQAIAALSAKRWQIKPIPDYMTQLEVFEAMQRKCLQTWPRAPFGAYPGSLPHDLCDTVTEDAVPAQFRSFYSRLEHPMAATHLPLLAPGSQPEASSTQPAAPEMEQQEAVQESKELERDLHRVQAQRAKQAELPSGGLRLVFLDVDGVLAAGKRAPMWEDAMVELKRVLDCCQAQIVMTSSWRMLRGLRQRFDEELVGRGWAPRHGKTPIISKNHRDQEILQYIEDCGEKVGAWVAIDDLDLVPQSDSWPPSHRLHGMMRGHMVECDEKVGLTTANADRAIELMQSQYTVTL